MKAKTKYYAQVTEENRLKIFNKIKTQEINNLF